MPSSDGSMKGLQKFNLNLLSCNKLQNNDKTRKYFTVDGSKYDTSPGNA